MISILTPRYYFADYFRPFYPYFLSQPHTERVFQKGDYLWRPGQPHDRIHYFISGNAVHFAEHETGRRRIISFHGPGTVFPGYHTADFRIELSLTTAALSPIHVLEFTIPQFQAMFEASPALSECVINWYARYVNRFLFETIHQEFNSSQVKLCNLLYLLTANQPSGSCQPSSSGLTSGCGLPSDYGRPSCSGRPSDSGQPSDSGLTIGMTQEDLADILGISRVQITRELTKLRNLGILSTARGKLTVTDLAALTALCTGETV